MRLEFAPFQWIVLDGHVVGFDRGFAVALQIVAVGFQIAFEEAPDLRVPVNARAADTGAQQKRAEMTHRQRLLVQLVADGERIVSEILEQMMAPHIAQLVLCESRCEIGGRIAPDAALQCQDVLSGVAELLCQDGGGPAETDEHDIDGRKPRHHRFSPPTSRDGL